MSRFAFLSPTLAVAGTLSPTDFAEAALLGFKTIINNRPDGEEAGQLTAREEIEFSRQAGIAYIHVPAAKHEVLDDHVLVPFGDALATASVPILLHCRSGLRSTIMWVAVSVENGMPLDAALATAKAAGHDLTAVREEIAERGMTQVVFASRQRAAA
jgi:uncharacterized protein (TIGR01244 family)